MGLAGSGHAFAHAWELVFPAVAVPMARDLGLPFAETVSLGFVLYLLFGLGAPLAGWLADRFGGARVLVLGLGLGGAAGTIVSMVQDPAHLVFALGALGLAASMYHPAGLGLLSQAFDDRLGRALAINGMAGNVGIAGTPLVAGLLASVWGWRTAFLVLSLPALVVAIYYLPLAIRSGPSGHLVRTDESQPAPRSRALALASFAIAVMCGGLVYRIHTLVMPALLGERFAAWGEFIEGLGLGSLQHLDNLGATVLVSIAYAMGLVGQWWGGRLADSRPLASVYLSFHVVAAPLLLAMATLQGPWLALALFIFIFFSIGMQPVENSLIARLTSGAWRSRGYAAKFVLGFGVGSLGAWVVEGTAPEHGLQGTLLVAFGLQVILVGAAFGVWTGVRPRVGTEP